MKIDIVRAPIAIGSLISGGLVLAAVLAVVTSSPRWDDHLINAVGVFSVGLFASLTLWLVTAALRPQPGAPRRTRFIRIAWLAVLAVSIFAAIKVALFIDGMRFL